MKKLLFIAAALALLTACQTKDNISEEEKKEDGGQLKEMSFTATLSPLLKTSISSDESLLWARNDRVSVFDGEGNRAFRARNSAAETTLTGEAAEADVYYAVYPYDEAAQLSGKKVGSKVDNLQNAISSDATGFAGLAAAKSSSTALSFKLLSGVLKFTIASEGITDLEIRAEKDIAGSVEIDFSAAEPSLSVIGGEKAIRVRPAEGAFKKDATYYVSALPVPSGKFTLIAYKGSDQFPLEVSGKAVVASTITDLGSIEVASGTDIPDIAGKWMLIKYGSRAVEDVDGTYVWWSDEHEASLGTSADNTITFKTDGTLELGLGTDGKALSVDEESDFTPALSNPKWTYSKEGGEGYIQFSGGAFPLIVANADGVNAKYHVVYANSGEIRLEIKRVNGDGEGWFQIVLRPSGVKTFTHKFALGDFGIDSTDANEGWYTLNEGEKFGKSTFDGFEWTLAVETTDIYYVYQNCIRIGVGAWHANADTITPDRVTFSSSSFSGSIKKVSISVSHNNSSTDNAPEVEVMATVGGLPFGSRYNVTHNADGPIPYVFSSAVEASGAIDIDIVRKKGNYGLYISEIEVVYSE